MVSEQYIRQGEVAEMREIAAALGNEAMVATTNSMGVSYENRARRHVEFANLVALELAHIEHPLAKLLIRL